MSQTARNNGIDALRGYAIVGILLIHSIERFNLYVFPDSESLSQTSIVLNKTIWDTIFFLFSGKTYSIFALLFGYTFYLQFWKRYQEGYDFGYRFLWRMILLFGFGWINNIFFPGEILISYAVLSPTLFLVRKFNDNALIGFSIFFLLTPWLLFLLFASIFQITELQINLAQYNKWSEVIDNLYQRSFIEMVKNSYKSILPTFIWSIGAGRLGQTIGLFSLGYFLGRKGLFEVTKQALVFWKRLLIFSLIASIGLYLVLNFMEGTEWYFSKVLDNYLNPLRNLLQTFFVVSLFTVLYQNKIFVKIVAPLKAYGRMSLSNYILQSIVGSFIFYPYALYVSPKVSILESLAIGIALAVFFVWFCNFWIKKYQKGPFEKLWHKLTWISFSKVR